MKTKTGIFNEDRLQAAMKLDIFSLCYRVQFQPDEGIEFLNRLGEWEGITNLIKFINQSAPKSLYGEGNPNNGTPLHTLHIGNENSRVVYVEIAEMMNKTADYSGFFQSIKDICQAGFYEMPDELTVLKDNEAMLLLRLWWD